MYIQSSSNLTKSGNITNNTMDSKYNGETFHDLLKWSLNNRSSSRPPKVEVTGVLVPISPAFGNRNFKYKLDSDSREYFLRMNSTLENIAKKIEWEKVTVKGYVDFGSNVLEVEKIKLSQPNAQLKNGPLIEDCNSDSIFYEKVIARLGKLEPAIDFLAS